MGTGMPDADSDEYGWFQSRIIERRVKRICSIRDKQFDELESWYTFRKKLLERFAAGGPITEEVWEAANDFWRDGVKEYVSLMPTKKAENEFVAEQLSNGLLDDR
jgi:hypothetical protein